MGEDAPVVPETLPVLIITCSVAFFDRCSFGVSVFSTSRPARVWDAQREF